MPVPRRLLQDFNFQHQAARRAGPYPTGKIDEVRIPNVRNVEMRRAARGRGTKLLSR